MDLLEAIEHCPHLASPGALAHADTNGKWVMARHLSVINRELMAVALGETERLIVNVPFQHGKTVIASHYFPAWLLLLFPHMRIILASYSETYSASFGSKVRDVIARFGPEHGIELKADTKSKNEWVIEGHGGGMVCKGRHGSIMGRAADIFLMDDVFKDASEATSPAISDSIWEWYQTTAYSRLGPRAPIVIVNTRWARTDLCGRILAEAKDTGEDWRVLKFKAIADEHDILGRQPGEALWPERVPLKRLELIRAKRGRWWNACWQQEPEDEASAHFKPRQWPRYADTGDAYAFSEPGAPREIILKRDILVFTTVDWAWSTKQTADYTAVITFGLTPDARLLILDVVNQRYRPEQLAPAIAGVCRKWHPSMVAVEAGHPTLSSEYRRHPEIPEVRWLSPESRDKLQRALPAIVMGENGRICLPQHTKPWEEGYCNQLASFTGVNDDHDDLVDATSYGALMSRHLRSSQVTHYADVGPGLLVAGREDF